MIQELFKSLYILFYFVISLFFMEVILKVASTGEVFTKGLFISFLFSLSYAVLLFLIFSFFKGKYRTIISAVFLGVAAFAFASQLIYHSTFRTYYSMYSAGNATQVTDFWRDIITLISANLLWITILFLPMVVMIFLRKLIIQSNPYGTRYKSILIISFIALHLLGVASVYAGDKEQHSAYDLYFNSRNPILSVDRLGLLTTMRIDLQRLTFGWSPPALEVTAPIVPPPPESSTENPNETDMKEENEDGEKERLEFNLMDIDFPSLIANEENQDIQEMHQYFMNVHPTEKNEFTGNFEGYNLILITAESYAPYAVQKEVTPTLYKLTNEGYRFTNFYTPLWEVSTSDGEYVALQGLLPKSGIWSFEASSDNYLPFVMGNQFNKLGFKTMAFHNHTYTYYSRDSSHPNLGYEYKGIGNGLDVQKIWPASDLEMMEVSIPEYIDEEPFHTYYLTMSGHMQYSFDGNNMALKNQQAVADLPFSMQGRAYIATHVELDRALEHLLNELEKAGVADRTLIAISSDHYPYGLDDSTIDELAGHEVEKQFEIYKNDFILYNKNMEPMLIDKPSSSLDILPTLSNLLGLEYDSRLVMGTDIFSNSDPLVMFLDRSFITEKGKYNAVTREFIPNEGFEVDEEYIEWVSDIVNSKFYFSSKILETNYYQRVLGEDVQN